MKFIELTNIEGDTTMVNVERIELFSRETVLVKGGTRIYFSGDDNYVLVLEKPSEVLQKIKEVSGNESI